MRLVIDALDRRALELGCPRCDAPAGTSCLRSGGAVVGGSPQRFGEYVHLERVELARRQVAR